jgi:hypothetical protein
VKYCVPRTEEAYEINVSIWDAGLRTRADLMCDVDYDGNDTLGDLTIFACAWHSQLGDFNWVDNADFAAPFYYIGLTDTINWQCTTDKK